MNVAPVLFVIFNRPDTTELVFQQIRKARPTQLFIAADGPRPNRPDDASRCAQARSIVANVDWPCTVKTLFREQNLGCKRAVSSAINWFFQHVEEGIILEDDCLPDPTFFSFCTELLAKYRNDSHVMHIGGVTFQAKRHAAETVSYYFSGFAPIWGWATWRRAWQKYDVNPSENAKHVSLTAPYFNERLRWFLKEIIAGRLDTWDTQWLVAIRRWDGLSIIPRVSLIQNIGFGLGATHTVRAPGWLADMTVGSIDFLVHPKEVKIDTEADWYDATHIHRQPWYMKAVESIYFSLKGLLASTSKSINA
ncbi:hemolytic protein HlpA [Spirosoma harenae]